MKMLPEQRKTLKALFRFGFLRKVLKIYIGTKFTHINKGKGIAGDTTYFKIDLFLIAFHNTKLNNLYIRNGSRKFQMYHKNELLQMPVLFLLPQHVSLNYKLAWILAESSIILPKFEIEN